MLAALMLLLGTGLVFYGLWEARRSLAEIRRAEPELRAAGARLEELLADLDEATAAVDRRTGELEDLLARADACLAALRQATVGAEPGLPRKDPWPAPDSVEGPSRAEAAAPAADPGASAQAETAVPAGDPGAPAQAETEGVAGAPGSPRTLADRVGELADQGLGEEAIAARLGLTRGEVRLALGLRGLRRDPRAAREGDGR